MCRNIRPLFNFEPPAGEADVRNASLQFIRKIAGTTKPSKANEHAFNHAVDEVAESCRRLLASMVTTAPPKNRDEFEAQRREKSRQRFAKGAAS
jgi:hypothetical protein